MLILAPNSVLALALPRTMGRTCGWWILTMRSSTWWVFFLYFVSCCSSRCWITKKYFSFTLFLSNRPSSWCAWWWSLPAQAGRLWWGHHGCFWSSCNKASELFPGYYFGKNNPPVILIKFCLKGHLEVGNWKLPRALVSYHKMQGLWSKNTQFLAVMQILYRLICWYSA